MKSALWTLSTIVVMALASTGSTASEGSRRIGIFALSIVGADQSLQQTAIDALATAVANVPGCAVISRSELDAMLGAEKLRDNLGCNDVSCMAEIGMAAGVDRVVGGSVSQVERALVISLQLVNTEYATTENRVTLTWEGPASKLPEVLGAAAELLVMPARARRAGSVAVAGIPASAAVTVDGQPRGVGPVQVEGLEVGVHALHVESSGYESFDSPVVVRSGQVTHLPVSMALKPEAPFYTKWWFWTAAAAVLAGGATATVLAVRSGDGQDKSPTTASGTFSVPPAPSALRAGGQP